MKSLTLFILFFCFPVIAGAADYYIDPLGCGTNGDDDTGDGTLGNPWFTFNNVNSYYNENMKNFYAGNSGANWVDLAPGDTVHVLCGTFGAESVINFDCDSSGGNSGSCSGWSGGAGEGQQVFFIRGAGQSGSEGNPVTFTNYDDQEVKIEVCDGTTTCNGIKILQANDIDITGIDVYGGHVNGVVIEESNRIGFDGKIHDVRDGDFGASNGACLKLQTTNDSTIILDAQDCYSTTEPNSQNTACVVAFQGTGNDISGRCAYTEMQDQRKGIFQKHGCDTCETTIHDMEFSNCGKACIATSQKTIVDNILAINDSEGGRMFDYQDQGGGNVFQGLEATRVTAVNMVATAFDFNTTYSPNTIKGDYFITDSIFISSKASYDTDEGIVSIDPNGEDTFYDYFFPAEPDPETDPTFNLDRNCYYNPNGYRFNFFGLTGTGKDSGFSETTLAAWQSSTPWDDNSFTENPNLDGSNLPQSANCMGKGYGSMASPEPTPTPTPEATPTPLPGGGILPFLQ